jgi:transcription elongation factor Elf1
MIKSSKPVIIGNGSNNVIRFTCPDCKKQNEITCRMPKDFFRETRDASCRQCKTRFTVVSGSHYKPVLSSG